MVTVRELFVFWKFVEVTTYVPVIEVTVPSSALHFLLIFPLNDSQLSVALVSVKVVVQSFFVMVVVPIRISHSSQCPPDKSRKWSIAYLSLYYGQTALPSLSLYVSKPQFQCMPDPRPLAFAARQH